MASCIHGKKWDEACYEDSCYRSTTPPAANVVERMCGDYGNLTGTDPDPVAMAASLAVAREGYVSLEDVEKAILAVFHEHYWHGAVTEDGDFANFRNYVRARLAKPAEQTDMQRVEKILWGASSRSQEVEVTAAEIVAALRDGKEGK